MKVYAYFMENVECSWVRKTYEYRFPCKRRMLKNYCYNIANDS